MNILYCGDGNIAKGVLMSAISLAENSRESLNVYIVTAGFEYGEKEYKPLGKKFGIILESCLKTFNENNRVFLYDESELFKNELPSANLETRFTPFCMLRLIADMLEYLPEKILYIDNDVICRGDFSEFYNKDITDYEFAGVLDHYGKWFFRRKFFHFDYVNSGVLLLNLNMIRKTGLFRKCRERCRNKKMLMPDQSALNKLSKRKMIVERVYNEQRYENSSAVFRHFSTTFRFFPSFQTVTVKPWETDKVKQILHTNLYDDLFDKYKKYMDMIPESCWE